jgi:tetratricopeptide (TPR) repeat protein
MTDEAIEEFIKASQLDPTDNLARYCLGETCYLQGKLDEAAEEYTKALDLDPKNPTAHFGLGDCYRG